MMRLIAGILFLLFTNSAFSQVQSISRRVIRSKSLSVPYLTPDSLARQLTASYKTDRDKVESIFRWITENISYRVKGDYLKYRSLAKPFSGEDPNDTATVLKPLDERVAEGVLQRRSAVCDGYSRLFKTLCDYAAIRSEVITGYARTNTGRGGEKFKSNHTWNAVYFDSAWHLLDATWASGYITYADEFVQHYDPSYFLTPPARFIHDHYPEDLQWTLLSGPPALREFQHSPFKPMAFIRYRIQSFSPAKGIIEASVGDTVLFQVSTEDAEKKLVVRPVVCADSMLAFSADSAMNNPSPVMILGNTISYAYTIPSSAVEWLHIIYNDEVIMRYKVTVRNSKEAAK